jgi:hydrogenase maturation protein HypF
MGRLFDAFSFIAGVREEATYEAQGPMEMESLLDGKKHGEYAFGLAQGGTCLELDHAPAVRRAVADRLARVPAGVISARFHSGVAAAAAAAVKKISAASGVNIVCLSGGVFQNRALLEDLTRRLSAAGLKVLANARVPANDGGIALGQAWYALNGFQEQAD